MKLSRAAGEEFQRLVGIIRTLRRPGGCPWDRRQDVRSIVDYFLEEAYETAEACLSGRPGVAAEELGDILMEVVFLARIFEERGRFSVLDGLGGNVPALLAAFQIGQRVSACGFDWPDVSGALEKVREEVAELEEAVGASKRKAVEEELGDLLFALSNVARHLKVNPEIALRRANRKFTGRFKKVEQRLREKGRGLASSSLNEMDGIWDEVKDEVKGRPR